MHKEDSESKPTAFLNNSSKILFDDISQRVSDFADKFLPIRPTLRSTNPLKRLLSSAPTHPTHKVISLLRFG